MLASCCSHFSGLIKHNNSPSIIIEVSGIGFEVFVASPELFSAGTTISLYTYLAWHPEQGPTFYGFSSQQEKDIFLLVTDCPGVGPKLGLSVLRQLSPQQFLYAIHQEDKKALSSISGIGPKRAEQIIVQLKHKVATLIEQGSMITEQSGLAHWKELSQALTSLGYSRAEVTVAFDHIKKSKIDGTAFDQLLRQALSFLSKLR